MHAVCSEEYRCTGETNNYSVPHNKLNPSGHHSTVHLHFKKNFFENNNDLETMAQGKPAIGTKQHYMGLASRTQHSSPGSVTAFHILKHVTSESHRLVRERNNSKGTTTWLGDIPLTVAPLKAQRFIGLNSSTSL